MQMGDASATSQPNQAHAGDPHGNKVLLSAVSDSLYGSFAVKL